MTATLLLLWLMTCQPAAAHHGSSVTVSPSRSQFVEYEKVSVSCEQFRSAGWKIWRYTTSSEPIVSPCGSGWGEETSSSSCLIETAKKTDSGVYWCQSKYRDSSNTVNINVTGGSVILQRPVHPVREGDDVPLSCQSKTSSSNPKADFLKDGNYIGTGHMTIRNFSKSDEGSYKCNISGVGESLPSWLRAGDDSAPASFTLSPGSSHFFEYDNLTLSCGDNSSFSGWKVLRAVTAAASEDQRSLQSCGANWGTPTPSGCLLQTAKKPDTGIYWCESATRRRSNSVEIHVHGSEISVILQSPALPVMEGDDVTLSCQSRTPPPTPKATFYKDGFFIRTESTGNMTIQHVSRSDEGQYKCHISDHGESPPSWLLVRVLALHHTDQSAAFPALSAALYLVKFSLYGVSTFLMVSSYCQRPKGSDPPVSMTMPPPSDDEDDEGLDQPYEDVMADVTTEHHF